MSAYYNEFDEECSQWLRNLIDAGMIAPGDVDSRSIEDVAPDDLRGYTQCHFFAGIGVWSYALRLAGWPDDRPVWTGSCPCQPFSSAGKGKGFADERHLWPAWDHLIIQRRPPVVFGEQVASKAGLAWLDLVQSDLEGSGYACGPVDTCAAGFGAPHWRQRQYWAAVDAERMADLSGERWERREGSEERGERFRSSSKREKGLGGTAVGDETSAERMGHHHHHQGPQGHGRHGDRGDEPGRFETDTIGSARPAGADGELADNHGDGRQARGLPVRPGQQGRTETVEPGCRAIGQPGPTNGFWGDVDWLFCRDDKWRPVEPGTFPLVDGSAYRMGSGSPFEGKSRQTLLKGYGNAIVAPQATEFIAAFLDAEGAGFDRLGARSVTFEEMF